MNQIPSFDYLEQYYEIESDILQAITTTLRSGDLILGRQVETFERGFKNFLGGHGDAVGVNSGTDALVICLLAFGVGPGDEVVTVSNTAVPTISAIRIVGAKPVFCDVDEHTALMDLSKLYLSLSRKTKAIIPVHLFGNMVDVGEIYDIISDRNIVVIEDCAQAHGAKFDNKISGTLGDAAAFSFYPTKNLGAYGDAGLCFSTNLNIATKMRKIRTYGFNESFSVEMEGVNSRMDEIQAAILNVKLPFLEIYNRRRYKLADLYDSLLKADIQRIVTNKHVDNAYHQFVIRVENRDKIREYLLDFGIKTNIHYQKPIHLMDGYKFLGYSKGSLPVTEMLAKEVLSLPLFPELGESQVSFVCEKLNEY